MNWIEGLEKWRTDRRIITPSGMFQDMIEEEINEYELSEATGNEHEMVDAIADLIVLSANELELMGYDINLVMQEVVKEISSRQQDPEQAVRDWSDEKWQKWREQPLGTLYKANFSKCKKV